MINNAIVMMLILVNLEYSLQFLCTCILYLQSYWRWLLCNDHAKNGKNKLRIVEIVHSSLYHHLTVHHHHLYHHHHHHDHHRIALVQSHHLEHWIQ